MDFYCFFSALLLGTVEGLTEFLPVSSTGHLIVAGDLVGFNGQGAETFYISIQAGAIVAVCWHYRNRILSVARNLFRRGADRRLAINTAVAFLPAAVFGACLSSLIKESFFNSMTVAVSLIAGGIFILWFEREPAVLARVDRVAEMDGMSWKDAFGVGLCQCLALVPGVSRSGATIIGGMVLGLSRRAATEFSFFLSIPTIFGATVYDLSCSREFLSTEMLPLIGIGFVMSFLSAVVVVRWLLKYVSSNSFLIFGWYRVGFGIVVLGFTLSGLPSL